jgi:hypothetical protein
LEELSIGDFNRSVRVGSELPRELKEELVAFLRDNGDVFAWNHEGM